MASIRPGSAIWSRVSRSVRCSAVILIKIGHRIRPARTMIVFCVIWHAMIFVFAQMQTLVAGVAILVLAGVAQSLCIIPMSVMLLRNADEQFRGRIMGIRMLAVYGLPIGLLISGPLVARIGYPATATLYCVVGLAFIAVDRRALARPSLAARCAGEPAVRLPACGRFRR